MNIKTSKELGDWKLFTLINNQNMEVSILNFGGIITRIIVPDKHGKLENVVIGYRDIKDYQSNSNYFGALIGRVAGRIANSTFNLNDATYTLAANEGAHHLHGGKNGFHQVVWKAEPFETDDTVGLTLTHTSQDKEDGYPGKLDMTVTYTLNNNNQLTVDYQAIATENTVFTMTNHSYFNLSGNLKSMVHQHHVTIPSNHVVELNEQLIPTGKKMNVLNTPFDFRTGRYLMEGFKSNHPQNKVARNGYDHYFIFDQTKKAEVIVQEEASGRRLTINTNQPGMVMYTSNMLDEGLPLNEGSSKRYLGVCFETQASPASLEHDGFPSILLEKHQPYTKQTIFTFDTI
ncbi:aldose epimerase family protein [Ornithinibacillus contaminans]|uniref:aldose epimerase family protein n=1 Tax=Ornithinibacillus contaminans TaxID=694055 RepID=UPI00064D8B49|nr:aldose epimerase family protein [Ornithinibacillus contaminans]